MTIAQGLWERPKEKHLHLAISLDLSFSREKWKVGNIELDKYLFEDFGIQ